MIGSSCGSVAVVRSADGLPERYRRTVELHCHWHCLVRIPISGWRSLA